jgi:hypothetical protein
MKRSEMLKYLESELLEFVQNYNLASDTSKVHKIKMGADGILALVEGLAMVPSTSEENIPGTILKHELKDIYSWEPEDEN